MAWCSCAATEGLLRPGRQMAQPLGSQQVVILPMQDDCAVAGCMLGRFERWCQRETSEHHRHMLHLPGLCCREGGWFCSHSGQSGLDWESTVCLAFAPAVPARRRMAQSWLGVIRIAEETAPRLQLHCGEKWLGLANLVTFQPAEVFLANILCRWYTFAELLGPSLRSRKTGRW